MANPELRLLFLELDKCFTDQQRNAAVLLVKDYVPDVADRITSMDQLLGELFDREVICKTDLSLIRTVLEKVEVSDGWQALDKFFSQLSPGTKEYIQHPAHQDTFIGRKEELKHMKIFFRGQEHDTPACLFLSGFPGVGKTRLACRICDMLSKTAEIVFLDLRKITDVSTMRRSMIQKIDGPKQTYDQETLDMLVKDFERRKKEYVVVLDNAEDILNPKSGDTTVLDFMSLVERLCTVGHSDHLKIIITSRFQNPLTAETGKLGRKHSLKIHVEEMKLDKMSLSDSVEFIKYKSGKAELRERDPEKLAKLCGYCPLAMKLVAGRLKNKVVKPRDMIKMLERSGASLRKKKRPGMQRLEIIHDPETAHYEDMKSCIQSAFHYVTPDDQNFLLRLSVIPASFNKDTAAAVSALRDPREIGFRLQLLMYYNLVDVENPSQQRTTASGQFGGPTRWRLHTLLKMFLDENEKNRAETEALEEAKGNFVRHYARIVKKIATNLDSDYSTAMRGMENEEANIFHFFFLQNKVESRKVQTLDDPITRTDVVYLLELMANTPERLEYFKHRVAKAKEDGHWRQYAEFRCWEALQYNNLGENTEVATSILEDAYEHLSNLPSKEQTSVDGQLAFAHFYHIWGNVCVDKRDYATGIAMLEKSVVIRKHICDDILERPGSILIKTLNDLGHAYYKCSEYSYPRKWSALQRALTYHREALELRQSLSLNHCDTVTFYMNLGACYHSMKDFQKAVDTYQAALDLDERLHLFTMSIKATILKNMALSLRAQGSFEDGFQLAEEAYDIMKKNEDLREPARCLYICGLLQIEMKNYDKAIGYFEKQLELEEKLLRDGRPHSDDWQGLKKKFSDLCKLTDSDWKHYSDRFQNAEKAYENATRSGQHFRKMARSKRRRHSDSSQSSTDSDSSQKRTKKDIDECINPNIYENEYFKILSKEKVFSRQRDLSLSDKDKLPGIGNNPPLPIRRSDSRTGSSMLPVIGDRRRLSDQAGEFQRERNKMTDWLRYYTKHCNIL
ncbi:uncharacterized protein LOC135482007 [Liolophura sinensis]|uniref:uncharacterized protein LOC135482007 n=1 Tax=Liolophura sinensis TaxID=3198878 RepID=UPI0031588BE5